MTRRLFNKSPGFGRLRETGRGRFRLQYRDPDSGRYLRRQLPTESFDEAITMAVEQKMRL